jgi:hypothetical protein
VEYWRTDPSPFGQYVRAELDRDADTKDLLASTQCLDPTDPSWGGAALTKAMTHLNHLVADMRLAANSPYAEWLADRQPRRPLEPYGDEESEIFLACKRFRADGRPHLLNRLILEKLCLYEGQQLLKPWVARARGPLPKPFHVINLAMNLVGGRNLAWQQRKAGSFIVTPLHSGFVAPPQRGDDGSVKVWGGHRPSVEYGGGITLGTAVAISGAAASPNMGYHSSKFVAFLMTLLNVRLGWWLGNPAEELPKSRWGRFVHWLATFPDGRDRRTRGCAWRLSYPRHQLGPVVDEALGRTSDQNQYVYLSDGGHFENLGLYEMVRRRCHVIVVSDATCDPKCALDDLGNAVRKIRTDLGVPVRVDDVRFHPAVKKDEGLFCAVGEVDYRAVDGADAVQGTIIYIKAALRTNMPVDVYNYSQTSKRFPHEPTSDQWFNESQFESYRRLGEECVDFLCCGADRTPSWKAPKADPRADSNADSKADPKAASTDGDNTAAKNTPPFRLVNLVERSRWHVQQMIEPPARESDAEKAARTAETAAAAAAKGTKRADGPAGEKAPEKPPAEPPRGDCPDREAETDEVSAAGAPAGGDKPAAAAVNVGAGRPGRVAVRAAAVASEVPPAGAAPGLHADKNLDLAVPPVARPVSAELEQWVVQKVDADGQKVSAQPGQSSPGPKAVEAREHKKDGRRRPNPAGKRRSQTPRRYSNTKPSGPGTGPKSKAKGKVKRKRNGGSGGGPSRAE